MYDVISAQLYEKNFSKTKTINSFFFYSELSSSYLKPSVLPFLVLVFLAANWYDAF